jgi:hypothetical protein
MASPNPYTAPRASIERPDGSEVIPEPASWRLEGSTLVVRKGVVLPPICLYSGQNIDGGRVNSELSWTPVWFKVMIFLTPVLAVFAYSYVRRSGTIDYALGPQARWRSKRAALLGVGVFVAAFVVMWLSLGVDLAFLLGVYLLFPTMLIVSLAGRPFRIASIDRYHARLELGRQARDAFSRVSGPR